MKVGIAGITGKFARLLATHLLAHEGASIKGYCRTPSKVPEAIRSSPRVELTQGEAFDREAVRSFVQGCDVVVCCYLGDDKLMVEGQKLLIDACDELQVTRYLFLKDPMIHVKAYLETKANVAGVHILIGGFMEPVLSPFFNILDPSTMTFRYWGEGDEVMEGTTYDDAARFTAAVALDPNATGVLRFVSGRASIRDIARSFEKVYGIKPSLERRGSLDELYEHMHNLRSEDPQNVYGYMALFFYYYWINGQTFVGPQLDNGRYSDIKPVDWEGYMSKWPIDQLPTSYFALGM
ncbi:NmrA-like family protein [Aspergillus ibericus CBS 121593]|uniref:NmrA-like family protein n=1 Tax=Aspergillus ibericus CBS 121593 TaxID=1448316 RepID=A0A395GV51_9EURO|nr:nmrA-like family protein [Aspergillus ibericus CBS 121593]RAK99441.1 nmrA-like family protein [Aspergillus ibericus CBS 121593]